MDEERDIVTFEDDAGNQLPMEVLDYLYYEGKEYAMLTELQDDDEDSAQIDVFIMEVVPVDEENEEFVPVDEKLAQTLIQLFESNEDDDIYEDDEDDE